MVSYSYRLKGFPENFGNRNQSPRFQNTRNSNGNWNACERNYLDNQRSYTAAQKEMAQMRENSHNNNAELINYAHCEEFARVNVTNHAKEFKVSWIIDTGASNHMCCNKSLFINLHDILVV
ncbi:hypothetical protein LIER_19502 [Lithospermum erythrorhizon]|uniref:Retrovirus-related Pol polyprotein from transposon TNT 1-94-like beta-barrel domain-containing protein n=1 Tax=Lithospermum erythrorhizon TaxID=34254 RepID=A0AAV3QJ34_LITER